MFNLFIYPYMSEMELMEQVILWSIQNREDDINIYFAECGIHFYHTGGKELEKKLNKQHHSNITVCVNGYSSSISDFCDLSGDKGVLDLRRNISEETRFRTHKKRFEDNIPVVYLDAKYKLITFNQSIYDKYMNQIIEQKRLNKERRKRQKEEAEKALQEKKNQIKRTRDIMNRTMDSDDKYFISEEDAHLYFYKPVNIERLCFQNTLL